MRHPTSCRTQLPLSDDSPISLLFEVLGEGKSTVVTFTVIDLVTSIVVPASDPKASEVFFLVNNLQSGGQPVYVDELIERLPQGSPLMLLWGENDPWIVPERVRLRNVRPRGEFSNDGGQPASGNQPG